MGDDLSEGKPTLPLIYALERANPEMQMIIRDAITKKDASHSNKIIDCIAQTGSLALTESKARESSNNAIDSFKQLPNNQYKEALISLAEFTVNRSF